MKPRPDWESAIFYLKYCDCVKNNYSQTKWVMLPAHSCHFVCWSSQTKYLYRQYPELWFGKCHIPVAKQLKHSPCSSQGVVGSNSDRRGVIFQLIKFRLFQERLSTVEIGAVALARLVFRICRYHNPWIGTCLIPAAQSLEPSACDWGPWVRAPTR